MKIINPGNGLEAHISTVLHNLAASENCDGEPYDQMVAAADYIRALEAHNKELDSLLRRIKNKIILYNPINNSSDKKQTIIDMINKALSMNMGDKL